MDNAQEIMSMLRPDRDAWWMGMAFYWSMMSHDRETKNGAIIVNNLTHRLVAGGYVGFPMGCSDSELPATRPEKYAYMQHAEQNAVLSVRERCSDATMYCTLEPCERCIGAMLNNSFLYGERLGQSGVRRIVYWESREHPAAKHILSHHPEIQVERYSGSSPQDVLRTATRYMDLRPQDGLYDASLVASDYASPE